MDIIVSYFTMPVGVLVCFGPAIIAWLLAGGESSEQEPQPKQTSKA